MNEKFTNIAAHAWAAIAAIWFTVALTIAAEFSASLKNFLASVTGHHWVTKSVAAIVLYAAIYLIFMRLPEPRSIKKEAMWALWSAILGGAAIFLFFVWHFLES